MKSGSGHSYTWITSSVPLHSSLWISVPIMKWSGLANCTTGIIRARTDKACLCSWRGASAEASSYLCQTYMSPSLTIWSKWSNELSYSTVLSKTEWVIYGAGWLELKDGRSSTSDRLSFIGSWRGPCAPDSSSITEQTSEPDVISAFSRLRDMKSFSRLNCLLPLFELVTLFGTWRLCFYVSDLLKYWS